MLPPPVEVHLVAGEITAVAGDRPQHQLQGFVDIVAVGGCAGSGALTRGQQRMGHAAEASLRVPEDKGHAGAQDGPDPQIALAEIPVARTQEQFRRGCHG
ncbi:hypothetical protein [Pseudomonas oryzihabitans]|uniref:hypothetical protein n=1 Tax=Pseudomonas oryzihabitans TaxID=47885 RepID=UPI001DA9D273|nr:hypothetical protein [Pseudomonas oryzihabitans]HJE68570.1 hypothetical protein [Pseudomonas oryzihabitans]